MPGEARKPGTASDRQGSQIQHPAREAVVLSGVGRMRHAPAPPLVRADGLGDPEENFGDLRAAPPQSRMLRSLPIHERVDVGLGLFAVTGATVKERELRRTDPIRDVAPRTSRVAGAGLRVNF